jgi:hypothetical protein
LIVAAQHIEQMPQTWYKDFENRVKKLFSKEHNQYRLFSRRKISAVYKTID